jgi:hypothetical protein
MFLHFQATCMQDELELRLVPGAHDPGKPSAPLLEVAYKHVDGFSDVLVPEIQVLDEVVAVIVIAKGPVVGVRGRLMPANVIVVPTPEEWLGPYSFAGALRELGLVEGI